MKKYLAATLKDIKLLLRDIAGLAMLFGMPMLLIIIMSLLQDSTFKALEEKKLPVIILDLDKYSFGKSIVDGLTESEFFRVTVLEDDNESVLREKVEAGDYQIGIVIRQDATSLLKERVKRNIVDILPPEDSLVFGVFPDNVEPAQVDIFFDPITKNSFKQSITSALNQYSSAIESKIVMEIYSSLFQDLLGVELRQAGSLNRPVEINPKYAGDNEEFVPNSVQHNVPAWTIFAMFFIVIPLAGNIIKERESGITTRLSVISGTGLPLILGKVTTYFIVGLLQAASMLLVGVYFLPLLGLPQLVITGHFMALVTITIAVSLAASGYGVAIGTLSTSQEQSSIFGSISVVILAAIGGIWVPTFMMSEFMQKVSSLSPLNWAINGYYDIFLRNADWQEIMNYFTYLFVFFIICIMLSWYVRIHKSRI